MKEPPFVAWVKATAFRLAAIDYRSLALLRVALGLLLIYDVAIRFTERDAFLSDTGVYSCETVIRDREGRHPILHPSIHTLFCYSDFAQTVLLLITGAIAFMMLIGYRTTFACIVSWLLVCSMQNRNDKILHGGDTLYRLALFWISFLPMGETFSVDAALKRRKHNRPRLSFAEDTTGERHYKAYYSVCCLGIMLQVCHIYFWGALQKERNPTWKEGTAVYYSLQLDSFALPFAIWCREVPYYLLEFMSYATLYLEKYGPILLWCPFFTEPLRLFLILSFIGMHTGIALTLRVEVFSIITPTCLIPFIPPCVWDRAFAFFSRWKRFVIVKIYHKKMLLPHPQHGVHNSNKSTFDREYVAGGFVETALRITKEFCLLPQSKIFGVEDFDVESSVLAEDLDTGSTNLESGNTVDDLEDDWLWMVVDENGKKHVGVDGVIAICRASILLFWLVPLLRISFVYRLNCILYNKLSALVNKYIILRGQQGLLSSTDALNNSQSFDDEAPLLPTLLSNSSSSKIVDRKIFNRIRRRRWRVIKNVACLIVIIYVFFVNLSSISHKWAPPAWVNGIGYNLKLLQNWKMFSEVPQTDDWFVFKGLLKNGQRVDAFTGEWKDPPVTKMQDMAAIYPSVRWQKFISKVARNDVKRESMYGYFCRRWNNAQADNPDNQMVAIESYHLKEYSPPPGQKQTPFTSMQLPRFSCDSNRFDSLVLG